MDSLLEKLLNDSEKFLKNNKNDCYENDYNIFSVLNLIHREIYHSRFLADLLNPDGLHNQRSLFLEKFLEIVKKKCPNKIPEILRLENTVVITEEVTTYGNLDISIKNDEFYIIIENKVWAGDQDAQLDRYSQTIYKGKEPILIYLTPDGTKPTKNSLGNLKEENIIKFSYKKDINNWIKECKDSSHEANITNILNQYIKTIKFEKEDIMEIDIENKGIDEIKIYLNLQKSLNQAISRKREKLLQEFFDKLNDSLYKEFSHSSYISQDKKFIYFTKNDISYGISLDSIGLYLGFYKEGKADYSKEKIAELVENNKNFKQNRFIYLAYELTSNNEYYINFIDSSKIEEDINNIVTQIKEKINNVY